MGMFEAGEGKPEVIEPVRQWLTRDGDPEAAHVGEIRQAHTARRVLLAEDHVAARAVKRPPMSDATLQGAAHARSEFGMAAADLLEHRHRTHLGRGRQHRHDLALPHSGKRVGPTAATRLLLLGRQPRIGPQSDTQSQWKTRPSRQRWQGHWSDGTSCTTSSGSR
jgi:hypothetical protein